MTKTLDQSQLAALPHDELIDRADRLGIVGAKWLPRSAVIRAILTIERAREMLDFAKEVLRGDGSADLGGPHSATTASKVPPIDAGHITRTSIQAIVTPQPTVPRSSPGLPPAGLASETLALLYESQGKPRKAAAIRRLARKHKSQRFLQRQQELDPSRVTLESRGSELRVTWQITERAWRGAELQLGGPGQRAVRLVALATGRRPETQDLSVTLDDSEEQMPVPLPGAAFVRAAVGLRTADGRFTSAAHSEMMRLA